MKIQAGQWKPGIAALAIVLASMSACKARKTQDGDLQASILESTVYAGQPVFTLFSRLPASAQRVAYQVLDNMHVGGSIFAINATPFVSLGGRYNYDVTRSGSNFMRQDSWVLGAIITPGTILANAAAQLPVYFQISDGKRIEYARVFRDRREALTALPKTPLDLPLSAERALTMGVGDSVSIPVNMGLELGARLAPPVPPLAPSAAAGLFWAGDFRLTIARLDETHFVVKATPSDESGLFFRANVGVDLHLFGFGAFGLLDIDNSVESLTGLNRFIQSTKQSIRDGEHFVVEYVFNLADSSARHAYEAIVKNTLVLSPAIIAAHGLTGRPLAALTFASLDPAEELRLADRSLPASSQRVARLAEYQNRYTGVREAGYVGPAILRHSSQRLWTLNWGRRVDNEERETRYVFPLYTEEQGINSWFDRPRCALQTSATGIFLADENWRAQYFDGLVVTMSRKESVLGSTEIMDNKGKFLSVLGWWYFKNLKIDNELPLREMKRYNSRMKIVIRPELFNQMYQDSGVRPEEYEKKLLYGAQLVTQQFDFRNYANHVPQSPLYDASNFVRASLADLTSSVNALFRGRWEGVHGRTLTDTLKLFRDISRTDQISFVSQIVRLMEIDRTANEVVPSFLVAMSSIYGIDPYLRVMYEYANQPPWDRQIGEDRPTHQQAVSDIARNAIYLGF